MPLPLHPMRQCYRLNSRELFERRSHSVLSAVYNPLTLVSEECLEIDYGRPVSSSKITLGIRHIEK